MKTTLWIFIAWLATLIVGIYHINKWQDAMMGDMLGKIHERQQQLVESLKR
jgi:hypothetical protein